MRRNKLIYALAAASLVVSSDINKGGTWAGTIEQLDKLRFVPVYVRSTDESSAGLDALRKKGALPWPNPQDVDSFEAVFNVEVPTPAASRVGFSLLLNDGSSPADAMPTAPVSLEATLAFHAGNVPSAPVDVPDVQPATAVSEELSSGKTEEAKKSPEPELTPAEVLLAAVCAAIPQRLSTLMKDVEVAAALDVSNAQAKAWLQRPVDKGLLEKQKKPVGYVVKQKRLFK